MSFLLKAPAASTVFYANTDITTVAAGAGEFVVQVIPLGVGFFNGKTMRASLGVLNDEPFDTTTFRVRIGPSAAVPALNTLFATGIVNGTINFTAGFMLSLRRFNAANLQRCATMSENISYLLELVANAGLVPVAAVDTASLYLMITAQGATAPCSVHTAIVERL